MNDAVKPTALRHQGAWLAALFLGAAATSTLTTCTPPPSALEKLRKVGVLRVATVNSPTTYYVGASGPTGYEYDLAAGLAQRLGVKLEIAVATTPPAALALVKAGKADFAAASLTITPMRQRQARFSEPILKVVPQVVYRMGDGRPQSLEDLKAPLMVVAGGSHVERLQALKPQYPGLRWIESDEVEAEELLVKVAEGEIPYAVANSDLIAINQRYYPRLRVAFDLAEPQEVAWAFPLSHDDSLFDAATTYLRGIGTKELARLRDRHFGHVEQVDYIGAVALAAHVQTRLPRYRAAFEKAADAYGLDWRLLAAIGYQESHWDPSAVSPTGVRGIMQLTSDTASFLQVSNRDDPVQSIVGAARYLRQLLDLLPAEVQEPDRTWLALAAYNMGIGHLYDAQKLTTLRGHDARRWLDVRGSLPLLMQSKWHQKTRHGYARGRQAVVFVGNVRTYYDMLVWLTGGSQHLQNRDLPQTVQAQTEDTPLVQSMPDAHELLKIRTPLL